MLDLDKLDYFELFKETLKKPHRPGLKLLEQNYDNEHGRMYSFVTYNGKPFREDYILNGEINAVNFESETLVSYHDWVKNVLKIYQYKSNPNVINVRLCARKIKFTPSPNNQKLYFTKEYSLAIQFLIDKKQFKFQVKFPSIKDRITHLSFNTAVYLKPFIRSSALELFAIFMLKSNSNEFILKSPTMDFMNSVFENTGKSYMYFNVPNDKLEKITNPTMLYKYITGYKNLNKNILKYSLKEATIISHYIKEEDQQKFFDGLKKLAESPFKDVKPRMVTNIDHLNLFLKYYFQKIFIPFEDSFCDWNLIYDYVVLSKTLDLKLNIDINSPRRLKEEHDRLEKKQRAMKIPEFKTHEVYKTVLDSTEKLIVELIDDRERLAEESHVMNHCVYSYHDRINNGTCAIYSIRNKTNEKERWTLDLRICQNEREYFTFQTIASPLPEAIIPTNQKPFITYKINQLRSYNNHDAPQWVWTEVEKMITSGQYYVEPSNERPRNGGFNF